jgi:hypothetical protein
MFIDPVSDKALKRTDGYRSVKFPSVAFLLTGMITNTSNGGWEGVVLFDNIERFLVPACLDQGDIPLGARLCWTGVLTGASSPLRHKIGIGNGLGIRSVNRFSLIQPLIEFVGKEDRADLCTVVAASTFLHIHIAGTFLDGCLEMSSLTL